MHSGEIHIRYVSSSRPFDGQIMNAMRRDRMRLCCGGGQPHRLRVRRRFVFFVLPHDSRFAGRAPGLRIGRVPLRGFKLGNRDDDEILTICGHWVAPDSEAPTWRFESARVADDMARRLNAGQPIHRDKFIAYGAIALLLFELGQFIKWW